MADWGQQLESKRAGRRISPEQGMGEETQKPPSSGNTGAGALAGGLIGGLAGIRMGPVAAESTAAALSGLGDVVETGVQQALDPEREMNVGAALKSAGKESLLSLIGGTAVRGAVKVGDKLNQFGMGKLFDRVASQTTPEAQVAMDVLDSRTAAAGIPSLTPAERTQSSWYDFFDNIAKNSIIGSNFYRKMIVKRENIIGDLAKEYVDQFGAISRDPASLGDMLVAVTRNNEDISLAPARLMRNQIKQDVSTLGINGEVTRVRQHARSILAKIEKVGDLTEKTQGKKQFERVLDATDLNQKRVFAPLTNFSPTMPVADMIDIRSGLIEEQIRLKSNYKLAGAKIHENIETSIGLLNDAIEGGLKGPGSRPDLLSAWKTQNKMFASKLTEFGDELADQIIKAGVKNPASIAGAVLKSDTENGYRLVKKAKHIIAPTNIRDINNVPVNTSTLPWKKFQAGMIHGIFDEARDDTGKYSGAKFINKLNDVGKLTLTEAFGPQTTKELFDLATTLSVVQRKNPVSIGSMGIQMIQAGAILSLPFDPTGAAATILFGPAMLAKIFTTREGTRLFRQGLLMERTDPRWRSMLGRLATMGSVNYMEPDNAPRPQRTSSREDPLLSEMMNGPKVSQ